MVTVQAQDTCDIITVFTLRPIHDCMGSMFLGVDTVLVDIKVTKVDCLTTLGLFCTFSIKTMICQQGKHILDMDDMSQKGTAVNSNYAKVCNDEYTFYWLHVAISPAH